MVNKREYLKRWRKNNRDYFNQYMRQWRRDNPEKVRIIAKRFYRNNKEKVKQWNKKFRRNHPDYDKELYKRRRFSGEYQKYREKYKARKREYDREWNKNHREYRNYQDMIRRMRLRKTEGSFTLREWRNLKKKYNYTCPMCGRKEPKIKLAIDHVTPISKNGTNWIKNIQPLCRSCNSKKGKNVLGTDILHSRSKGLIRR